MGVVSKPLVRANAIHNAGSESATGKYVVHDEYGKVVGIITLDARQDHCDTALVNIFVDDISSRRGGGRIRRNRRQFLAGEWPIRKQDLELSNHGIAIEIATDCDNKVSRDETTFVKGFDISTRNSVQRGRRGIMIGPKVLAEREEIVLALLDGTGIVVAFLHRLQQLLLAQSDLVILKAGHGQNLAENGKAFVDVF